MRNQLYNIDPAIYGRGGFYESVPDLRRKFSGINRNPEIIKVPFYPISYSGLDWPRDESGDYLPGFSFIKGLENCTYTQDGSYFTEDCIQGAGFTLVPVCDPEASPYSPTYCGEVHCE